MTSTPSKTINSIDLAKKELTEDFLFLGDWQQRYAHLIDLGHQLIADNEHTKTDENRFYGCQANVWLQHSSNDQHIIHFEGCSDSVIVAGLMSLIFKIYSGRHAQDIIDTSTDFLEEMDLINNLTSQRSTGLMLMIEEMKNIAKHTTH